MTLTVLILLTVDNDVLTDRVERHVFYLSNKKEMCFILTNRCFSLVKILMSAD